MQDIGADLAEAEAYYVDQFPAFALQTTFVATYSLLEDELLGIARTVGRHLKIELDSEDLHDNGIYAAKKYLKKLCNITIPTERHWEQAVKHGMLRNICVHTRGRVKTSNTEVRKYVDRKTGLLSIDERNHLQFTREFCLEVLDNVESLLNEVYKLAQRKMSEGS